MSGSGFESAERGYDEIVHEWKKTKTLPYVEHILSHSLFNLIGPVESNSDRGTETVA